MNKSLELGRYLFAIAIVFFGVQYFVYGRFVGGLPPVPPWAPGGCIGAYLVGAFLIVAGAMIAIKFKARLSAMLLGVLFLLCVVVLHLPRIAGILYNGVDRTRALEPLALAGAAFAMIASLPRERTSFQTWDSATNVAAKIGPYLYALPLVMFGIQHFMYAPFIARLIPSWIPGHLIWTYFTGVAFIAAAIAIILKKTGRLASILLGTMFLLWTVLLHAPRVVAAYPHNGDEWNSAFVALAMSGGAFIVAATLAE